MVFKHDFGWFFYGSKNNLSLKSLRRLINTIFSSVKNTKKILFYSQKTEKGALDP